MQPGDEHNCTDTAKFGVDLPSIDELLVRGDFVHIWVSVINIPGQAHSPVLHRSCALRTLIPAVRIEDKDLQSFDGFRGEATSNAVVYQYGSGVIGD